LWLGKKRALMAGVLTLAFLGWGLLPAYARANHHHRSHHHHQHSAFSHHYNHGFYSRPYYYGYRSYSYINTRIYDTPRDSYPKSWYGSYISRDQKAEQGPGLLQAPVELVKGVFSIFGGGQSSGVASKTVDSNSDVKVKTTSGQANPVILSTNETNPPK